MVFFDDKEEQVNNLKNILFAFEVTSGLKVKYRKSVVVGVGDDHSGADCAIAFGFQLATFHLIYLGIPLGSKFKNKVIWETIIQRCQQKLSSWRRR